LISFAAEFGATAVLVPSQVLERPHDTMPVRNLDRRSFLRAGATAAAGLALCGTGRAQQSDLLKSYLADLDGNGVVDAADLAIARQASFTARGFSIAPNVGYDFRADVFGRGEVDQSSVDAVAAAVTASQAGGLPMEPRPITVAWHYPWYDLLQRPFLEQTVRYLGGDYLSNDPVIETEFNELKNELGITVDAVSWIPRRITPTILPNIDAGYFSATNLATRYFSLLYENTIALPLTGGRIDFRDLRVAELLVADFVAMAETFIEARDRHPSRIFLLDGRPVIFIFGSHSWGLNATDEIEFSRMADVVAQARDAFTRVYGTQPYLVGDELLSLASTTEPPSHRVSRTLNFEAVFSYHAANLKVDAEAFEMNEAYAALQRSRLVRATEAVRPLRNRHTNTRVIIIPSLAGGFAKHALPILSASRAAYADYLSLLSRYYEETYLAEEWPGLIGTPAIPAPVYTVGSWNEEFEGHCVFPSSFNLALADEVQGGFDWGLALRQRFGWNHYATRDILT